jgi:hypothetical protein
MARPVARLTITGGNATVRVGGGIQNGGLLTLNRTTVTGNVPDDCSC